MIGHRKRCHQALEEDVLNLQCATFLGPQLKTEAQREPKPIHLCLPDSLGEQGLWLVISQNYLPINEITSLKKIFCTFWKGKQPLRSTVAGPMSELLCSVYFLSLAEVVKLKLLALFVCEKYLFFLFLSL